MNSTWTKILLRVMKAVGTILITAVIEELLRESSQKQGLSHRGRGGGPAK